MTQEQIELVVRYTPDGVITDVNDAICQLFGTSPQDLIGRNFIDKIPAIEGARMLALIGQLTPAKRLFTFEHQLPLPNGDRRWYRWTDRGFFDADGRLTDCRAVGIDITELRDVRKDLERSEARAHMIVEHSTSMVIVCDDEGLICEANAAACAQLEMGVELVGCELASFIDPHELLLYPLDFTELSATQAELRLHMMCRPDGTTFPVEIRARRMPDNFILLVIHDTSEGRAMLGDIIEATTRERRRIGLMLHDDLGQQIAGIKYLMDSLLHRLERDGESAAVSPAAHVRDLLETAVMSVRNIAHSLNPVKLTEGGLPQALRTLAEETSARYGIACTAEIGELPLGDPNTSEHLYWFAQEAVTNAMRHADPKEVRMTLLSAGDHAVLEITDDGCGMDPAVGPSDRGMGLRNLQHRATLLHGRLDIDSTPQQGTCVRCTFIPRGFNTHAHPPL